MAMENTSGYGCLKELAGRVNQYWTGEISAGGLAGACTPQQYAVVCGMLAMHAADFAKSTRTAVDSAIAEAMREIRQDIKSAPGATYRQQLRVGLMDAGIELVCDVDSGVTQNVKGLLERKVGDFQAAMKSMYDVK